MYNALCAGHVYCIGYKDYRTGNEDTVGGVLRVDEKLFEDFLIELLSKDNNVPLIKAKNAVKELLSC